MRVLEYADIELGNLSNHYEKIKAHLEKGDFAAAQIKKMVGTDLYRAKLDHTNRLLFKLMRYRQETCIVLLEIINNHDYEKSRFLHANHPIDDDKLIATVEPPTEELSFIHDNNSRLHILNKLISFDETQESIFSLSPPLIIVGSAGSGKTVLTLEKMKQLPGKILYVTQSKFLTENARNLYYAMNYQNDAQEIDFLSYAELIETIQVPQGTPITFKAFSNWAQNQPNKLAKDKNKLFEEFKGVLTGSLTDAAYLSNERYCNLGIKQSIFLEDERQAIYGLFERYQHFMQQEKLYDENMLSYNYLSLVQPSYDYAVIDEVQDLTNIQIKLILSLLKNPVDFLMCGDANQIVHPNFFSWSKVKSLFYETKTTHTTDIIRILCRNYRNSRAVNEVSNLILKIKNHRFGSIDKESHYLMETCSTLTGEVHCVAMEEKILTDINQKTKSSTHYAVIVLDDDEKPAAKRYFNTPLVFSIREAKGLEYDNVIIFNIIGSQSERYREIAGTLNKNSLANEELLYSRAKDKSDKSLEIYKFYINALYVACTRAIQTIVFVEKTDQHAIFPLLDIRFGKPLVLTENRSSLEDWQREAYKLQKQGKHEQADEIRRSVLNIHPVPWTVYQPDVYAAAFAKLEQKQLTTKEEKITLLEYAIIYDDKIAIQKLANMDVNAAKNPERSEKIIDEKYWSPYRMRNTTKIHRDMARYGVDFRNCFNQTPLMLAAYVGNVQLITEILSLGVGKELTDNRSRNAFQIALFRAINRKNIHYLTMFPQVASLLIPSHIIVQQQNTMQKIDNRLMEFLMLNIALVLLPKKMDTRISRNPLFSSQDFLDVLAHLPTHFIPERRKKRAYISSILSKNEIYRVGDYNRKLFLRIRHGQYILHQDLAIKISENWVNVYENVGLMPPRVAAHTAGVN